MWRNPPHLARTSSASRRSVPTGGRRAGAARPPRAHGGRRARCIRRWQRQRRGICAHRRRNGSAPRDRGGGTPRSRTRASDGRRTARCLRHDRPRARRAAAGVDAAQIYSLDLGHGRMPRADEQEAYFRDVLDATTFPSVISIHQSVGYFVDPELIGRLLDDHPHVIGVNCTHPDLALPHPLDRHRRRPRRAGRRRTDARAFRARARRQRIPRLRSEPRARLCAGVTAAWA